MEGAVIIESVWDGNVRLDNNGVHFIFDNGNGETKVVTLPVYAFKATFADACTFQKSGRLGSGMYWKENRDIPDKRHVNLRPKGTNRA